jgi:Ca-activated chloride channel family protein
VDKQGIMIINFLSQLTFANPNVLYLLILLVPMIIWYVLKYRENQPDIQISTTKPFEKAHKTYKTYFKHIPFVLRLLAIAVVIIICARPQRTNLLQNENIEGIDIILALDVSTSMLAEDLKPNRLEAAKDVAAEFIMSRPNDNIGLVVFAAESFTQSPLTTDHTALVNLLQSVQTGIIEDGTAIGLGLATAVNRIKDSEAESKVIILLTDGENNRGDISPIHAAEIAKTFGIRVYTIGVGTKGTAPYPFQTQFGIRYQDVEVNIDEPTLTEMAKITGVSYFRATDNQKLASIYKEIDAMEKTKINVERYTRKNEEYMPFAILLLILLLADVLLRNTILRQIP